MAAPRTLLALFLFVILFSYGYTDECPSIYDGSSITPSFDCPQSGQSWDWMYCCDEYGSDQHCCNYNAYFGVWNTGAIFGVSIGGMVGVSLLVTLIIVCCVCAGRRPMPRRPVLVSTVHNVSTPPPQQQREANYDRPPAYNELVHQPPPKVGQYQQFTNQTGYPIN